MNKKEYITYTSKRTGVPKYRLTESLEAFIDSAIYALAEGKSIDILGFGHLFVQQRKARKARDPRNFEEITVPPRKVAKFEPGAWLHRAAAESPDFEDEEET